MAEEERQELQQGMVLGHYVLESFVGGGAMGEVWRGSDRRDGSRVAIKVLNVEFSKDPAFRARFEREAHVATLLKSPYTVQTYAFGRQFGFYYLVMEFVEGDSVEARLAHGPLPLDEALEIANDAARALEAASSHKLVHRDMKPSNIIVSPDGAAKLVDFGIAGQSNVRDSGGMFMGTVQYGAPEQQQGHADSRSDIYALGATLFHMLAGRPPYTGRTNDDILAQHASAPFPSPLLALQPEPVVDVVRRCMQKDPEDRYPSAADLAAALERLRVRIAQVRQQAPPVVSAEFRTLVPEPEEPSQPELPSGATVMLPSSARSAAPVERGTPPPFIPPLLKPPTEGTVVAPSFTPSVVPPPTPRPVFDDGATMVEAAPIPASSVPAFQPRVAAPVPVPATDGNGGGRRGLFIALGGLAALLVVGGVAAVALMGGGGEDNEPSGTADATIAITPGGSPAASVSPTETRTATAATSATAPPSATSTTAAATPTASAVPPTATAVPATQGPTQPPPPPTNTPAPQRPVFQIASFSGNCNNLSADVSVSGLTSAATVSGTWSGPGQINVSPVSVPPPGGTVTMPTGGPVTPGTWTLTVFSNGASVASRSTNVSC